ncbi:MAG: LysR family transcriptional regulator [Clostridia bacterium]|nr:LysR family transcriptional regulator [Clostridia bacterium]
MFEYKDYIYEVYCEGSFTAASRKLFISQPALSATVKKMEEKIGCEIFDRSTTPVRLTEVGKAYIESVKKIRLIEREFANRVSDIANLNQGSVSIGGTNFVFSCILPEILKKFSNKYPKIKVSLSESFSDDLKDKAIKDSLDIIVDYDFDEKIFKTYPLKNEKIYISAGNNSAVAQRLKELAMTREDIKNGNEKNFEKVSITEFADEDFLLLKRGNNMHEHAMSIFHEAGVVPNVKMFVDQMKTSFELSRFELGVAFVTDTLIFNSHMKDVVFFRLDTKFDSRTAKIAVKRNSYTSGCIEKFIALSRGEEGEIY